MNGFIFYRGKSLINGVPIVGIATLKSDNVKTGDMVQTWILRDNGQSPLINAQVGADAGICGSCRLRPTAEGGCYVDLSRAPNGIFAAYLRGMYPQATPEIIKSTTSGRMVRLGAYGDPAAIPLEYWQSLIKHAAGWTGYTHQWRRPYAAAYQSILMASADTPEQREEARAAGWRTFTIRLPHEPLAQRESACPASPEGGNKLKCQACTACNGTATGRRGSIAIVVHGSLASRYSAMRAAA
jgi:hypothetical protein